MIQATDSTPLLSRPHTLRGTGRIRIIGSGELVLRIEGRGRARIIRGPNDTARFRGQGRLRHLSSARLEICGADGHLLLEGAQVELEFDGGPVHVAVQGRFHVETDGRGRIETARGAQIDWGRGPTRFRLEGPHLVFSAA